MIGEGMKVRFVPYYAYSQIASTEENWRNAVTGTICYINWEHKYFTVEYDCGGTIQKESFKFWEIGKAVKLCG